MSSAQRVIISRLGNQGDGLATTADGPIDVPFALPGEEITVNVVHGKDHSSGKLVEILKPSSARVSPPCSSFGTCGGCRLQHMNDAAAREWKLGVINHLLEKSNFSIKAETLFVTPPASRRRVTFTAIRDASDIRLGFHMRQSHEIISIRTCHVIRPELAALIEPLRAILMTLLTSGQELSIHATVLNGLIEIVLSGMVFSQAQTQQLISWAATNNIAQLYTKVDENAEYQVLLSQTPLIAHYGKHEVILPPAAFMQASDEAEINMLATIIPYFKSSKHIADLFCGTGLFALNLYDKNKTILSADADGAAIGALQVSTLNLKGFKTERRNLFREPYKAIELKTIDGICLDPPRAGAKEQCVEIARSKVLRIAYVSCNPVTFMRDARILTDGGYKLTHIHVIDQFLWSQHIELIGLFSR